MHFDRRVFLASSLGALAAGCVIPGEIEADTEKSTRHTPLELSPDALQRVTVCSRPFRPSGPRLEAESMDGKMVVHNYGHGGSGWSLSWGCASDVADLVLAGDRRQIAVIGAGAMGLTTALTLAKRGAEVTIYAKEFPSETRSARASGVWSPSSRIALNGDVDEGFSGRWENWARITHAVHSDYIGTRANPVEKLPQYWLSDDTRPPRVPAQYDYMRLDNLVGDLEPSTQSLTPEANPFPIERARTWPSLVFNIAQYSEQLVREFKNRGGELTRKTFPDRAAILALDETVIVNCTGMAAKQLWDDRSLVPVRGQINWFPVQSRARYGVYYNNVFALSRRDGVLVQYLGPNNDWGYGDASETIDPQETADALATLAPVFTT